MACWLFIAGAADSLEFARCERIGEIMQLSLPSARMEVQAVLPNEWTRFLQDKQAELGFPAAALRAPAATAAALVSSPCGRHEQNGSGTCVGRRCPGWGSGGLLQPLQPSPAAGAAPPPSSWCESVVWNRSGQLVGAGADAFAEFARVRYQVLCDLGPADLAKNARANLQLALQARQQLQLRLRRETRRAVVAVDMQVDFSSTGRLGTGAAMDGVVPVVNCTVRNHEWASVVFLQLLRRYEDFADALAAEAARQHRVEAEACRHRQQQSRAAVTDAAAATTATMASGGGKGEGRRPAAGTGPGAGPAAAAAATAGTAAAAAPPPAPGRLRSRRRAKAAGKGTGRGSGDKDGDGDAGGGLGLLKFHPHCIEGETGSRIHPYLSSQQGSMGVAVCRRRPRDFQPLLRRMLPVWRDAGVEEVFLCGVSLEGSLPALARTLHAAAGFRVMIVSNACCEIAAKRHITASTAEYRVVNTNEIPLASTRPARQPPPPAAAEKQAPAGGGGVGGDAEVVATGLAGSASVVVPPSGSRAPFA